MSRPRRGADLLVLVLVALVGLGPVSLARAGDDYVEAELPDGPIPEEELLDVTIDLFSPSIDDHDRETLTEKGIQPSVRKAEARFIPTHLRDTLQSTGQWGPVRVVPGGVPWAELSVVGKIETSNGKDLKVRVVAWDATGRKWLEDDYERRAKVLSYAAENVDGLDPFQSLYNEIANDLVKKREKRKREELVRIHEVARLRFAAEFAPETFGPYLESKGKGRYEVVRLPDESNPMLLRLRHIRDRDDMFVDTLNAYYSDFYARMERPYDDWRANSYTEQAAYDSLNKSKLTKWLLGGAAIAAGIFAPGNSRSASDAKTIAMIAGTAAIKSGFDDKSEQEMNKAALEELGESFGAEVSGLVVDVDGKIVELKGSAEEQFAQWRALLREIAQADAALPEDINVITTPPSERVATPDSEGGGAMAPPVVVEPPEPDPPLDTGVASASQGS